MSDIPAGNWLRAFAVLAGVAWLASLALAALATFLLRRFAGLPGQRAIAVSFALQAGLTLAAWLLVEDPRDGLRFYAFILTPIAIAHLLLLPFVRKT